MVPAMHGDPLFRDGPRAEPQPEAEEVPQGRMEYQAAVRLVAMQIERDPEKHDLDGQEGHGRVAPEGQLEQTVGKQIAHPVWLRALPPTHPARRLRENATRARFFCDAHVTSRE